MTEPASLKPAADPAARHSGVLKIGEWLADPVLDELRRRGQVVKLEPSKMRLLMALASRPQQLVTLDQLLDEVWPGSVVTQSSVYQSISQLRSLLGDDASQPRYIATVPRKGYRLVAAVSTAEEELTPVAQLPTLNRSEQEHKQEQQPDVAPQVVSGSVPVLAAAATLLSDATANRHPVQTSSTPRRRLLLGAGTSAALAASVGGWWVWQRATRMPAEEITLAVLPFKDVSSNALEQPVADSLAASVIDALSRQQQIRITASSTSFQFRSPEALAQQAGQLAVTHVLGGELRRWQQGLQLKLSLHRAADSGVLWRQVLDAPAAALSSLAFSAANAALQALGVTQLLQSAAPMPAADAYELYLLGLHHQRGSQIEGILKARGYFQSAIDSDPGFALAYMGQAATWISEYSYGSSLSFRAMNARAQPLIDRALQLDPELPLALGLQGHLKAILSQHDEARLWLNRALEKAPNDASLLNWSGVNEIDDGWPARAQTFFARAAHLSPLAVQVQHHAGVAAIYAGQYDLAESTYQRAITLAPQHANGHWGLGILGFARGRLADSVLGYRKALLINTQREALWNQLAWIYLDLDLVDEAGRAFAQSRAITATPAAARLSAARLWVQTGDLPALAEALRAEPVEPATASGERDAVVDTALLRLVLGQKEAALQLLESVIGIVLADPVPLYNNWLSFSGHHILLDVATVYSAVDQRDKAEPFIEQASAYVERYARQGNVWHAAGYHRARIESLRGRPEAALAALESAVAQGWRRGWWLKQDPALQSLRGQLRFDTLLARIDEANQLQRQRLPPG